MTTAAEQNVEQPLLAEAPTPVTDQLDEKYHERREEDAERPIVAAQAIGRQAGECDDWGEQGGVGRSRREDECGDEGADHGAGGVLEGPSEHRPIVGLHHDCDGQHDPVGALQWQRLAEDRGHSHAQRQANREGGREGMAHTLGKHARVRALERDQPVSRNASGDSHRPETTSAAWLSMSYTATIWGLTGVGGSTGVTLPRFFRTASAIA